MELRKMYREIIPNTFLDTLGRELKNCSSILDLGCGFKSPIKNLPKTFYSVGVDIYKPSIEISKKSKIHDKYYNMNVLNIGKKFKKKSFDCVMALSVIEHLEKIDGYKLIKLMENIAKEKIIIQVPNGELHQTPHAGNNPYQSHISDWSAEEMKSLGFKVTGVSGLKFLKGEMTEIQPQIKWKPWILWKTISDITALFLKRTPELSFELLCIKNINKINHSFK